jgi:hypothetical protein
MHLGRVAGAARPLCTCESGIPRVMSLTDPVRPSVVRLHRALYFPNAGFATRPSLAIRERCVRIEYVLDTITRSHDAIFGLNDTPVHSHEALFQVHETLSSSHVTVCSPNESLIRSFDTVAPSRDAVSRSHDVAAMLLRQRRRWSCGSLTSSSPAALFR